MQKIILSPVPVATKFIFIITFNTRFLKYFLFCDKDFLDTPILVFQTFAKVFSTEQLILKKKDKN